MTGYGRVQAELNGSTISVELKTLNSKQLDIYCRLPKSLSGKEIEIRNLLGAELERGKIELNIFLQRGVEKEASVAINQSLVKAYLADLDQTIMATGLTMDPTEKMKFALSLPNAVANDQVPDSISEEEWNWVHKAVVEAITICNQFRIREGKGLKDKFKEYLTFINTMLSEISELDGLRIPAVKERLKKSLGDLLTDEDFDKNRFEQELIYYIEKYDISEEKQRLSTHLQYFTEILEKEANGKKLSFMAQELGREINTIGSKANDSTIQRLVVNMKDELEKIKEQTSNVL